MLAIFLVIGRFLKAVSLQTVVILLNCLYLDFDLTGFGWSLHSEFFWKATPSPADPYEGPITEGCNKWIFPLRILKHTESCIQFNPASYKCFQFQEKFSAKCRHTVGRLEFVSLTGFWSLLFESWCDSTCGRFSSKQKSKNFSWLQIYFLAFVNSL